MSSRVRVVLYSAGTGGGMGQYTQSLKVALSGLGAEVVWFAHPSPHEEQTVRKDYVALPGEAARPSPVSTFRGFWELWRAVRDNPPDLICFVFTHHLETPALLTFGRLAKSAGIAVTAIAHDPVPHKRLMPRVLSGVEDWLISRQFRSFPSVIVHSRQGAATLRDVHHASNIEIYPHPVNTPPEGQVTELRSGVLVAGTLRPNKDVIGVVRAWAQLSPELRSLHSLTIVGRAEGAFDLPTLLDEASRVNPGPRIDTTHVPRAQFLEHLAAAAVVVLPYSDSYTSGSGVAAECQGLRTPLLVSGGGSLRELVESGEADPWPSRLSDRVTALETALNRPPKLAQVQHATWAGLAETIMRTRSVR